MTKTDILINEPRIVAMVNAANQAREKNQFPFDGVGKFRPERNVIGWLKELGDAKFVANALYLLTTMVFADDSEKFFKTKLGDKKEFIDRAWIFDIDKALASTQTEDIAQAYFKAGYNKVAIGEWRHNCRVIKEKYQGDIRNFFKEHGDDALKIVDALERNARIPGKPGLRRCGHKLATMFVGWTHLYDIYELENVEKIGIPVDFHVVALVRQVGGVLFSEPVSKDLAAKQIVNPLMRRLCIDNGWDNMAVSENLWEIGSKCCNPMRHDRCPISNLCYRLISREPLDTKGVIDPTDTGRWLTRPERVKFLQGATWLFDPNLVK